MPPDISHYYGREVTGVETNEDHWIITLSGDVKIFHPHDDEAVAPSSELGGKILLSAIFSEADTRLRFGYSGPTITGEEEVLMNPTKYGISEPGYENGDIYYPQMPEELQPDEGAESASEGTEDDEATGGQDE